MVFKDHFQMIVQKIVLKREDKVLRWIWEILNNITINILLERFFLTRKTVNNNQCKIATNKQKKTIELVHNSAYYSTTYFTG